MPSDKGDGSMYKKIENIDERLDEHGNRIKKLEKSDVEKSENIRLLETQFTSIKTDFTNLENTIWKTAQSTQDLFSTQNSQQWELIKAMTDSTDKDRQRKHDLNKSKTELFWEWLGKVTVGGGIFIVALELLFGK